MASHGPQHYQKIWLILSVLLVVSFVGPFVADALRASESLEALALPLTLLTAFGIAFWKAWLVAKNFMHMNVQPRYVLYLLATCLVFMLLFYAGTAPDVMKQAGSNWTKPPVAEAVHAGQH